MGYKVDLTDNRFGKLLVVSRVEPHITKSGQRIQRWLCKCDCGNEKIIRHGNLKNGNATSCGCLHKEKVGLLNKSHGLSGRCGRLYQLWKSIRYRCYSKTSKDYHKYGGRGISMCDDWKNDFKSFHDWALENGYKEEKGENGLNILTIDRIDVNGNYEPSNCRFVTNSIQAKNKRNTMTDDERCRFCAVCGKKFKVGQRKSIQKTCGRKCGNMLRVQTRRENAKLQTNLCDEIGA